MNPFSKYLRQFTQDQQFDLFVAQWDTLEATVIGVYRGKLALEQGQTTFAAVWPPLRQAYPRWEAALRPHWLQTKAAGEPTQVDPFRLLLDLPQADAIPGNWRAMQHLPAAREAINRHLVNLRNGA